MKLLLTPFLFLFLLSTITAQFQKGTTLTGGDVSFNGQTVKEEFSVFSPIVNEELKRNFLAINPKIGFFTSESTLFGIGLVFERNYTESLISFRSISDDPPFSNTSTTIDRDFVFLLNPYFSHYQQLVEKLYFTTNINFLVGFGGGKYRVDETIETDLIALRFNVSPGLTYVVSEKWLLNAEIGQAFYNWTRESLSTDVGLSEDPINRNNNYGLSFSLNTFSIGFQYFLNSVSE